MNENMLPVGTLLRGGDLRVERQLGAGGFGNTYVVRNTVFDERFAMKEFFMKGINMRYGQKVTVSVPDNHASFDGQREKFKKEALRLRRLKSPHIVEVHDLFEENGTVYYVMDYIDGQSLADMLKQQRKPLTETEVRRILPQVLEALDAVHQQHIWHLDIKPGNIMVDRQGTAYLIDFGASKQMRGSDGVSQATSSALCYTPGYAPMEQVEQAMDKFGPWTDFYALGATLFTLLTNQQPPSLTGINEDGAFAYPQPVSQQMQALIKWMMSLSRNKRPQSVAQIRQFLGQQKEAKPEKTNSADTVLHPATADDSPETILTPQTESSPKRKRSIITTLFLWLFFGVGVIAFFAGLIWGVPDNLSAFVRGDWTPCTYSSPDNFGLPIMFLGISVMVGIGLLIRWKRFGFWLMVLLQLMISISSISGEEGLFAAYLVFSAIFDLLVFLLMKIPVRVIKDKPRRSAWKQSSPSSIFGWIIGTLAALWIVFVLIFPPIYAATRGMKHNFYKAGFYQIQCDLGNYHNAYLLAEAYLNYDFWYYHNNPSAITSDNQQNRAMAAYYLRIERDRVVRRDYLERGYLERIDSYIEMLGE